MKTTTELLQQLNTMQSDHINTLNERIKSQQITIKQGDRYRQTAKEIIKYHRKTIERLEKYINK
tara:strand:- start:122 stop:313 length:192 start_codon:yes stop_codon:yes gene_type:complete